MQVPWEAISGLGIYIVASTIGFVWWMATQTIKLEIALSSLDEIKKAMNMAEATFATKVELAKDITITTKQLDALWKKVEFLENRR